MAASRRVAAQHEDWLNLADAEPPWFSLPAMRRAMPDGLDPTPPHVRAEHKARWHGDDGTDPARLASDRSSYIDWLLRDVLRWRDRYLTGEDLPACLSEGVVRHGVIVTPAGVYQPEPPAPVGLLDQPEPEPEPGEGSGEPRVLVFVLAAGTDPRQRPAGDTWPATWVQRAALSCRHHQVPLAIVTDGDHLTLVHAPERGATGWGTWRASEFASEPVLLDSFVSILRSRRFIGALPQNTPEALLAESAGTQAEVTDRLGTQVRRAVELLVNAISRADRDRGGKLLAGVGPHEVYEAAVTVMMRTVFLLVAEENDLLPIDNPHYRDLYSIRVLRETLEQDQFEHPEALETRTTAWHRLLATSRAVHSGIHHEELSVPAYGGSLFDPDRFPFLEGRSTDSTWTTDSGAPIAVTDLDVLRILDSLLVLHFRDHSGAADTRRLSYRNVDVEQVGHIYERLLDHDAVTADTVVVGLVGKPGEEPEMPLPDLEAEMLAGRSRLAVWLSDKDAAKAGRRAGTRKQVEKLLNEPVDGHLKAGLLQACQGDHALAERIEPFANLLRLDLRGRPLVFLKGDVYVTETGSRRDSGTAYTTRELADEVVEHTLAPLCYSPGPQDTPDTTQWRIRQPHEILSLKVCDPAVGSGAILVAACRYLGDRLVQAWAAEGDQRAADTATAADDPNRLDVVVEARRMVAERCCYGVDRNPMAAEMAKLSMWLTTVAKDRPFTFLDHAIKSGDSLLGIHNLDQLRHLHLDPVSGKARPTPIPGFHGGGEAVEAVERLIQQSVTLIDEMQSVETIGPADIEHKQDLHHQSEQHLAALNAIADVLAGAALATAGDADPDTALTGLLEADAPVVVELIEALGTTEQAPALDRARSRARLRLDAGRPDSAPMREPMHWPIAFPEVFNRPKPGFDAMVGNPPFLGGQRITGAAGTDYRNHLVAWTANGAKGSADLVAYFFLNTTKIARSLGFLATNTIAQGDTSEVGLTQIIDNGWTIQRAVPSTTWPGDTSLEIAKVWATSHPWNGQRMLDGRGVAEIDEMLYPPPRSGWRKERLAANTDKSFQGSIVLGAGFTLSPEEAQALINKNPNHADVLMPFLGGEDLNKSPTQEAPRWIINFHDWPKEQAENYPDCFSIVEQKVKPRRSTLTKNAVGRRRAEYWWQYGSMAKNLYRTIEPLERVLVIARVSKTVQPLFVDTGQVLSEKIVVFAYDDDFHFGVLTSGFHYRWTARYSSSLRTDTNYSPSDVFDTFPQPPYNAAVQSAGNALDQYRSQLMVSRDLGLTSVCNLVHAPEVRNDADIKRLRHLHVELDAAVGAAYGWSDLNLEHDFHSVRGQGVRFTFSPRAAGEVLDRLLELNKKRYEAEVAAGLHELAKSRKSKRPRAAAIAGQGSLLGGER
jgi:hypothetical protein